MVLHYDNQSTIKIDQNPVHHDRTKHAEVDRRFIIEKLYKRIIQIEFVLNTHQLVDLLTKRLSDYTLKFLVYKLGLINIFDTSLRGV